MSNMERRIKRVLVNPEIFGAFCRQDNAWKCTLGLPEDAKFVGVYACGTGMMIALGFEHPSFEDVAPGINVPDFLPHFERRPKAHCSEETIAKAEAAASYYCKLRAWPSENTERDAWSAYRAGFLYAIESET